MNNSQVFYATGRRKEAVARVNLSPSEEGNITINGRSIESYFGGAANIFKLYIEAPLKAVGGCFNVVSRVCGGGISGQAAAVRLGIARALCKYDPNLRPILRRGGFLTCDARVHERKKYGRAGRRRGFQWTKR